MHGRCYMAKTDNSLSKGRHVAVVGSGYWGKNLVRNFRDLGVLRTICDANKALWPELGHLCPDAELVESLDEVLQDPSTSAIAVATPAETHADVVTRALLAGKDVLVEKPLAMTEAEGKKLVELADAKSRILMVGHLLWYHPAILKLKELVDGGTLGRIQYIYSNRLNLGKIRREENILWSFAPHDISVILGLLGETPEQVFCQGGNYLQERIADTTVCLLSFRSNVKAHIFVSWLHPFKEQKLVVVGDKKMGVFDDMEKEDKLLLYSHSISWKERLPVANKAEAEVVALDKTEPLAAECRHFLDCVQSRKTPRTDGREGLRVLSVLNRCQQSLESSKLSNGARALAYSAHESAFIDEDVLIGEGTTIWHVSHVMKGSRIGKNCRIGQNVVIGPRASIGDGVKIQNNVSVYEGVTLEDHVFCGPSMVFTNVINPRSEISRMNELRSTLVGRGASLGANCTIVCGVSIGRYAFVGAGAVVTKDVPAHALVTGVPAKVTGWVCQCGLKMIWRGTRATCSCGRRYTKSGIGVRPAVNA